MWGRTQRLTYHCPACGWLRITPPTGDVRLPGLTHFSHCPQCRSPAVSGRPTRTLDHLWDGLPEAWRKADPKP